MTLVMLLTATHVYTDSSGFTVLLKCNTEVRVLSMSVWLMNTRPVSPSSVTVKSSVCLIQVMLDNGIENTLQVTVAEKVTLTESVGGVTVTLGGSIIRKKVLKLQIN